jgi:hypothetical protein
MSERWKIEWIRTVCVRITLLKERAWCLRLEVFME